MIQPRSFFAKNVRGTILIGNQLVVDDLLFEGGADYADLYFVTEGVPFACPFADELVVLLVENEVVGVDLP